MDLETDLEEGSLHHHTIEFYQIEKHVIENGLCIAKTLTKYSVFAVN